MNLDIISEISGSHQMHYFCLISKNKRYDLTIGFSEHFYGKAMVTSFQTGQMVLLCQEDAYTEDHWAERLGIDTEDIPEFQEFFEQVLQTGPYEEQY